MNRPCLDCGIPTPNARCPAHTKQRDTLHHNPVYDSPRWRRVAKKVKSKHITRHGYMCPGWDTPPHLVSRLSADHVVALVDGGAEYDESNLQVLCVACNGRKDGGKRGVSAQGVGVP